MKLLYRGSIYEERFTINNKSHEEVDNIFNIFKSSYEQSTGSSWTYDKFIKRANNWVFFGDPSKGFVAVRPQRSGPLKMTGAAGSPFSIASGVKEMINTEHKPIWGMASKNLAMKMKSFGFIEPPAFLVKIMFKYIPSSVFGDVPSEIQKDGGVKFSYSDVGDATKYFFANKDYYKYVVAGMIKEADLPDLLKKLYNAFMNKIS
jgi:hypothetical protein